MKWISGDLAIQTDANGNYFGSVNGLTGFVTTKPILGIAQRIGLAGSEATLPRCSFWVPNGVTAYGYLMVRGDPVRGGTTYFRVSAFQT